MYTFKRLSSPRGTTISSILRKHAFVLLVLVIVAGASGCERLSRDQSPRKAEETLTIAVHASYLGSGLLYLAEARGYFAAEGLAVKFVPCSSSRDALQVLQNGEADLATVANTPLMFAIARDQPIVIVATIFQGEASHGILVRGDRGIDRVELLAGRRVAVSAGTDGHYALGAILAAYGLELGDLHLEDLAPEDMVQALQDGKVDAIATWEPWLGRAESAAPPGQPYLRFMRPRGFPHGFHLAARADRVGQDHNALRALSRGLRRAVSAAEQQAEEVLAELASLMALERDALLADSARYRFILRLSQGLLVMLEDQARWAQHADLLAPGPLPDFLGSIHLDALFAVDPDAVTVVR